VVNQIAPGPVPVLYFVSLSPKDLDKLSLSKVAHTPPAQVIHDGHSAARRSMRSVRSVRSGGRRKMSITYLGKGLAHLS